VPFLYSLEERSTRSKKERLLLKGGKMGVLKKNAYYLRGEKGGVVLRSPYYLRGEKAKLGIAGSRCRSF
jgi:hypothetical protein